MAAATDLVPVVHIPARARGLDGPDAVVLTLHRPSVQSVSAPVRLTRRGVVVVTVAVLALAVALLWVARLSAPSSAASSHPSTAVPVVASMVTVRAGDTLWSIADQVAPHRDPRAEIATLQRLNHLAGVDLQAGQVLRTR
jgi:LysM repeat protein